MYEYMLLAEEIGAKPIWVFNNGLAHEDSIPTARIRSLVEDTLDSLEFVMGNTSTKWGKLRAEMGHPEPWKLEYLSIGNEVTVLSLHHCRLLDDFCKNFRSK